MDKLYESAILFNKLLNIKYKLTLGRKGESINLLVSFSKEDFYHLIGLQYLVDLPYLKKNRAFIFNEILNGNITFDMISNSDHFQEIHDRMDAFIELETFLDNNESIFKVHKNKVNYSKIKSKYVLISKHSSWGNLHVFLDDFAYNDNINFNIVSFFPNDTIDYSRNCTIYTLIYKEKISYDIDGVEIENAVLLDKVK